MTIKSLFFQVTIVMLFSFSVNSQTENAEGLIFEDAAAPDAETHGMLLINRALIENIRDKSDEAKQILGEIIFSDKATVANIEMAKYVLASISGK